MSCHRLAETPGAPAILMVKGAPERVIGRCSTMRLKGEEVEFTAERKAEVDKQLTTLMNKGRRCLAMAELILDPKGEKLEKSKWFITYFQSIFSQCSV